MEVAIHSKTKLKLNQDKYLDFISPSYEKRKTENGKKYYFYYSGNFKTFLEAEDHRKFLEKKGFVSGFIVAFKDNELISIADALKISGQ